MKLLTITGFVAAIAAALSLVLAFLDYREKSQQREILDWQKVIVYEIVLVAGVEGIGFEAIEAKYVQYASQSSLDIPKSKLHGLALTRVILALWADGVLHTTYEGRYHVRGDHGSSLSLEKVQLERGAAYQFIFDTLKDNACKLTKEQLVLLTAKLEGAPTIDAIEYVVSTEIQVGNFIIRNGLICFIGQ